LNDSVKQVVQIFPLNYPSIKWKSNAASFKPQLLPALLSVRSPVRNFHKAGVIRFCLDFKATLNEKSHNCCTRERIHRFHLVLVIPGHHDPPLDLGFTQALDLPPRDLVPIWGIGNLYSRVLYEEVHFVFVAPQVEHSPPVPRRFFLN